jgi:hypothetical protein
VKTRIPRDYNLMAANRCEIRHDRAEHRRAFTAQRGWDVPPGESAPAYELVHQNPH